MSDETKFRAMDWLIGLATTVALLVSAWSLKSTIDHESRIGKIEDTRFTRENAAVLKGELIKEMNTPPRWVVDRLDAILKKQEENNNRLRELERKIDKGVLDGG